MIIFFYFVFLTISIAIIYYEYKLFKNILAPGILMCLSLLVASTLFIIVNIINEKYYIFSNDVFLVFCSFCIIQFIMDVFIKALFTNTNRKKNYKFYINNYDNFFVLFGIISSSLLLIKFYSLLDTINNLVQITYPTFQNNFGGGIFFYLRLINIVIITYFIGSRKKYSKKDISIIVYCLLPLILGLVKGILLIPLLSGVVLRLFIFEEKINIKLCFKIVIIGIVVFIGTYVIEDGLNDVNQLFNITFYLEKIENIFLYIISGINGFSINIQKTFIHNNVINPTFAPFNNLFSDILGTDYISNIPTIQANLGDYTYNFNLSTNTNTYCGFLIIYNGYFKGVFIGICWAIFSAIIYNLAINTGLFTKIAYSIWSFTLIMSCFDYWYLHSYWFYLLFIIFIFFKFKKGIKIK